MDTTDLVVPGWHLDPEPWGLSYQHGEMAAEARRLRPSLVRGRD